MRKRLRLLVTAAVMSAALFGASFTSFAISPSRETTIPDEPVPQSGYLVELLDEDVPLASPQTGNGGVDMTAVLAVLAGTGAITLLIAGKKPAVALR